MQNTEIIVTKDMGEKLATRPLYEQAFDDPKGFVDYYYEEKIKDNTMVICKEAGRVISMLHLNPYTIVVNGKEAPVYYVVAVATDKNHRRQGYMARVLDVAFDEMKQEGIPFCFLLPVDEAIYTDFGFETICPFFVRGSEEAALSYEEIEQAFDVYCKQDAIYLRRRQTEETLAQAGDAELLPMSPVIMAAVTNKETCAKLFGVKDDRDLLKYMKSKRCYFCEEV